MVDLEGACIKRPPPTALDEFERGRFVGLKIKKVKCLSQGFGQHHVTVSLTGAMS